MNAIKTMAIAAALALGVAGCVETAGTRVTIDTDTGDASVLECSTRLAGKVRVVRMTYGDVAGIRKATVTLESLTHKRLDLQARMVWADADGSDVDADGKPFRALVVDGRDVTTFTGMAPNDRCVKARLQVRETETAE
jgi:uncharacterized protein YcfL